MGTIIFEHKNAKRFNEQIATFHVIMKNVLMRNVAMIHSQNFQPGIHFQGKSSRKNSINDDKS